jgi:hypothetical protein
MLSIFSKMRATIGEDLTMMDQVDESTASSSKSGIYERVASYASEHPMIAATTFVLAVTLVAFVVTPVLSIDEGLRRSLYTVYCGFLFTGFIGGIVKMMMDNVATARLKRADDAAFVANVLDDLKTVHDCVSRARILISAHKSLQTYEAEARELIDARVVLKNVTRAIALRANGISDDAHRKIKESVGKMQNYLEGLTDEFVEKYEELARLSSLREENQSSGTDFWRNLQQLKRLPSLIASPYSPEYIANFNEPLGLASETLRKEYSRILRSA